MLFENISVPGSGESIVRRKLLRGMGAALGAAVLAPGLARAQSVPLGPVAPPSTVSNPPRDFSASGAPTTYFTDPDVLTIDPSFDGLRQPNAPIQRLWTGALWSEGPAWNSVGRYLVWSDIPNNRQLRWLEDDGHVSVMRSPSNNSNGNTFDFQGRQLSCEHLGRRVVRYELDGSATDHRRDVQRQAPEFAQRRGAASRRQLLVHRSALRRPVLRRHGRTPPADRPTSRAA
jgi:gluconolactonase